MIPTNPFCKGSVGRKWNHGRRIMRSYKSLEVQREDAARKLTENKRLQKTLAKKEPPTREEMFAQVANGNDLAFVLQLIVGGRAEFIVTVLKELDRFHKFHGTNRPPYFPDLVRPAALKREKEKQQRAAKKKLDALIGVDKWETVRRRKPLVKIVERDEKGNLVERVEHRDDKANRKIAPL